MTSNHLEPAHSSNCANWIPAAWRTPSKPSACACAIRDLPIPAVHCIYPGFPSAWLAMRPQFACSHVRSADGGRQLLLPAGLAGSCVEYPASASPGGGRYGRHPGLGSFIGDVHANILRAFGCIGVVTNGAVRNVERRSSRSSFKCLREIYRSPTPLRMFSISVQPVEVGHMEVRPGDLLHGDRHGVQTIPLEIAPKIPAVARK